MDLPPLSCLASELHQTQLLHLVLESNQIIQFSSRQKLRELVFRIKNNDDSVGDSSDNFEALNTAFGVIIEQIVLDLVISLGLVNVDDDSLSLDRLVSSLVGGLILLLLLFFVFFNKIYIIKECFLLLWLLLWLLSFSIGFYFFLLSSTSGLASVTAFSGSPPSSS